MTLHDGCPIRHRTWATLARCRWPRAAWIAGEGPFAVTALCRPLTVTLHPTVEAAEAELAFIAEHGCGHTCTGAHELIRLDEMGTS